MHQWDDTGCSIIQPVIGMSQHQHAWASPGGPLCNSLQTHGQQRQGSVPTLPHADPLSNSHVEKRNKDAQRYFITRDWKRYRQGPAGKWLVPQTFLCWKRNLEPPKYRGFLLFLSAVASMNLLKSPDSARTRVSQVPPPSGFISERFSSSPAPRDVCLSGQPSVIQ